MSRTAATGGPSHRRWLTRWASLVLLLLPLTARADLWSIDSNISSRFESNDNPSLSHNSSGTVNSLSLSTGLNASRQLENWATGVSGVLTGVKQGGSAEDRLDGSLGLTQSLTGERDTFTASANFTQDFNNVVQNADVTLGQGQRRTTSLSGSWRHSLTERLSTNTQIGAEQTRFGQQLGGAVDFRSASASAGLSYRLSETDTLSLSASHSLYRADDESSRQTTNSLNLGFSRALTEDTSVSLSLGVYRTRSSFLVQTLVCPLPVSFCQLGLVPFEIVNVPVDETGQGLQGNASYSLRFDEVSGFAFSAGSQEAPSGSGTVVRSDTVSALADRSFSETLVGSAAYAWSRSRYPGGRIVAQAEQQSLLLSLSKQLAPDLSLAAAYQRTQSDAGGSSGSASSNSVSISLNYRWPTVQVTR